MKLYLKVIITISLIAKCFLAPTNQRTACLYNLKEKSGAFGASDDSCVALGLLLYGIDDPSRSQASRERSLAGANWMLANCLAYYEKLKECKKEENNYIPTLHPQ